MAKGQQPTGTTPPLVDFQKLFNDMPSTYLVITADDPVFTILAENRAHAAMALPAGQQAIGRPMFDVFPDTSEKYATTGINDLQESFRRVIKTKRSDSMDAFRYDLRQADGHLEERYWRVTHYPILGADGAVSALFQDTKDITDEMLMNQQLERTEHQLGEALRIGQVGSWVWDVPGDKVVADVNLARLFGVDERKPADTSVELPLQNFTDAIHVEDRPRVTAAIAEAVASGDNFEEEYRTVTAAGETRWVIARGRIERDTDGHATTFPGVIVDITDRKQAEARFNQQLTLTNTIATSLGEGVYALDDHGLVMFVNAAAEQMLGWTQEELLGKPIHPLIHFQRSDGQPITVEQCRTLKALRTGRTVKNEETTFTRKDGSRFSVSYTAVPLKQNGRITGVVQSFTDITERKQAEQTLRFLASASKTLSTSLDYRKTLRGLAKLAVPAIADWCAIDLVDASRTLQQVALVHKQPGLMAEAKRLRAQRPVLLDDDSGVPNVIRSGIAEYHPTIPDSLLKRRAKSASEHALLKKMNFRSVMIVPLNLQHQTVGAITFVSSDDKRLFTPEDFEMAKELGNRASLAMTNARLYQTVRSELEERERLEAELRDINEELENRVAQRTAQLQETNTNLERSNQELQDFAYVASHDLQEPLRKIQAFSNLLSNEYAAQLGDGKDYLDRMKNAAARMSSLIEDLLSFSRVTTKAHPFQTVDLSDIAYEVIGDLETRIEETGGSVDIKDLPTVQADPMQMRQLLQNLIGNALKFSRPGMPPVVTVSAAAHTESGTIKEYALTVADNGIGFDEKYLDRIFAVFQRLHGREQYQGTGIGLAICRKIAERHGGTITAHSVIDKGARFIITLPVNQKESV